MRELVALDPTAGDFFVHELRRAWDRGDAVLPVDPRLPPRARARLVEALGATRLVTDGAAQSLRGRPVESGDALVVATSGTSGEPKGVVLTHDAVQASARLTSTRLGVDPARDCWLACLPLAHIGGLSVVTRAVVTATPLVVHDGFDAGRCEQAARQGATLVSLVVTALGRIDPGLFRLILLGGSAIPKGRPTNTVATYGMTETGSGVVYDGQPLDGVEVRIVDGEIQLRSPTTMRCYRDGGRPFTSDGWLLTGDGGRLDEHGRLTVLGRLEEVIVTGGEKVWPASVERLMGELTWVREVAVVGRDDPTWGQEVTAVVVVEPGREVPALEEIRDSLGESLPRYALPRRIETTDALPRTSIGKVRRADI